MIYFIDNTYTHKMTVERNMEVVTNGVTSFNDSTIYTNVPCAVTKTSRSGFNANQSISKNDIVYDLMLFCNPQYVIETGDKITVTFENGQVKDYEAGEGFYYIDHAEIPIRREVEA